MSTQTITTPEGRTIYYVERGDSPDAAIAAVTASAEKHTWLAVDTETTGTAPSDKFDYMRSVQVGTKEVAALLDPFDGSHRAAIKKLLADKRFKSTAHNANFDFLRLRRAGVIEDSDDLFSRTFDTMTGAKLVWSGDVTAPLNLKDLTVSLCGVEATSKDALNDLLAVQAQMGTKGVERKQKPNPAKPRKKWTPYGSVKVDLDGEVHGDPRANNTRALIKRDEPAYIMYCAADVFDTAHLAEKLYPVVQALWPERNAAEHRLLRLVYDMQSRGIRLDTDKAVELVKDAARRADKAAAELDKFGVDVRSTKCTYNGEPCSRDDAIGQAIIDEGVDVPRPRNKKGELHYELDKFSLKKYASEGSKVAPLFREWKAARGDISTHIGPVLKFRSKRIHADIQPSEARTGRMSCSQPNMQNVPPHVRPCYMADEDQVLISADFASIEMRVAAAITGDPELLDMYCTPLPANATERDIRARDPYWRVAWQAFGKDATVEQRKTAKTLCLGRMYGGSDAKLAENADVPLAIAKKVLGDYNKVFATLNTWWKDEKLPRVWSGVPFWTLPSGRFQALDPSIAWAGFNTMIQGLARDLLLDAMFRIEDAGLAEHMLLPIHDELLFQVPAAEAESYRQRIEDAMAAIFNGVPIVAEAVILGQRWMDKDDIKKATKAHQAQKVEV